MMAITNKKKILVVDADGDIRDPLQHTLKEKGYTVQTAIHSKEGLERLRYEPFDIIIVDIKIPIIEGAELLKAAKRLNSEIVSILISRYSSIESAWEAHTYLAFDYVVKLVEPKTIENCIDAAITRLQITHELEKLMKNPRILVVDDETMITNLFEISLKDEGYYIEVTNSGEDALEKFKRYNFDIAVTDIMMPDINGMVLMDHFKKIKPEIVVIVITGYPSVDSAIEFIRLGAYDYVTKPLDPNAVINSINRAWDKRFLELQKEDLLRHLQNTNLLLTETNLKLKDANFESIRMLARACEVRDDDTGSHVLRINYYSTALAKELGLEGSFIDNLGPSSILHDVGKIHIPDHILKKQGRFTDEERKFMEKHPLLGERILGDAQSFQMAREIARWHHENWDGTGYPDRLKGETIPISARIVRLADAYDAMVTKRHYKLPWTSQSAYDEIVNNSGSYLTLK